MKNRILLGDCADVLPRMPEGCARLLYIDPPFNTGATRVGRRTRVTPNRGGASPKGARTGFGGRRYEVAHEETIGSYADRYDDFCGFLMPRIESALRCLTDDASIFVHLDYREAHYVKVALDGLLGRGAFMNELIWAYDYGGRSKRKWSAKHDTILWYARDPKRYHFDFEAMDRIPYMAPGLVSKEKAARGKTPTDVWWHTIVPTNGKERTGYPTQKPLGVLERIIKVHTAEGDMVLDCFAGSGTTGHAAAKHGRRFALVDQNPEAVDVMSARLGAYDPEVTR